MLIPRAGAVAMLLLSFLVGGCSDTLLLPSDAAAVNPLRGPAPTISVTPMKYALTCLARYRLPDIRLGVSEIVDGTGAMEGGTTNSRALTQRPDMMMVTALARAGATLVNRSSVNVAEWELNKAMEKKLGEGHTSKMGDQEVLFRPVKTGSLVGSTHYVTGAITELNWNIESGVAEGGGYSIGVGRRIYRVSIAIDVMVTETASTRVAYAESFEKQLIGIETSLTFSRA